MKDTTCRNEWGWPAVMGAWIVAVLLLSIALIAAGGWNWFQQFLCGSSANWVQAIGSIAAIVGAAAVGRRQIASQIQLEQERHAEEARKRLSVIDALLEAVETALHHAKKQHEEFPCIPIAAYYLDRIENASKALAKIDLFSCPPSVVQPLLHLFPMPCQNLLDLLRKFNESFDKLDDPYDKYLPVISNSFMVQEVFLQAARKACSAGWRS